MALIKLADQGFYDPDTRTWFKEKEQDAVAKRQETINYLTRQILDQNTTKYWTGEGYGSYEANARGIATWLNNVGITDIKQFAVKQEPITEQVEVIGKQINGNKVFAIADDYGGGSTYIQQDAKTGQQIEITKEQYDKASPLYGKRIFSGWDSGDSFEAVDQSKVTVNKDGTAIYDTGRKRGVYVNKDTGQVMSDIEYGGRGFHYVGDEVDYNGDPSKPNQVAQTFAGKGGTGISVQFAQDGTPYFFTHYTGSSSDWGDVAPIIAFGLAATGIGGLVGGALTSAAGVTTAAGFSAGTVATASAVAGSAVIGGTLAELAGGDFLKGAVSGAISAGVGNTFAADIGSMLGLEGKLAEQVGGAILAGAKAEISGGDFLKGASMSGLISTVSNTTGFTEKDIKSTISTIAAFDSGDPLRIAASLGNMTKLDYFNDKKASEIMTKLSNNDYSVNADYTLGPTTDGLGLKAPPTSTTTFNEDGTVNYDLFDFSKTTTGEGLKMPTNPNLAEMGGGQGITTGPKPDYIADLGDSDSYINKPAPDVKVDTTGGTSLDVGKGLLAAGTVYVGQKLLEPSTSTPNVLPDGGKGSYQLGQYSQDIYKDAPIKGFAMRKFEDEAGNTKYIPFIGDRAQLKVPDGFKPVGFKQGGFVTRRS